MGGSGVVGAYCITFITHRLMSSVFKKETLLFIGLGGFFITNAVLAEFIGSKLFSAEKTLGWEPLNFSLLGQTGMSFNMTAGVLLWPFVFIMTDLINEYFGQKGVRLLSYLTAALITYAYVMVYAAIHVVPADFWLANNADIQPNINVAFERIFGQGLWIIAGSLIAFLVGQLIDVYVFHRLRRLTGAKNMWIRATGSTLVSQLIDSFIVLFVAFYLGPQKWSFALVIAVGLVNYCYKFLMALALTPLLYAVHWGIDTFLGKELAHRLTDSATKS